MTTDHAGARCAVCGAALEPGAAFCGACGARTAAPAGGAPAPFTDGSPSAPVAPPVPAWHGSPAAGTVVARAWAEDADLDELAAPVWRRLVALLADQVVTLAAGGLATLAVLPTLRDGDTGSLLVPALVLLVLGAAQWFAEAFAGRTLGGALLGTRTVSVRTGRPAGLWAVLVRSVVQAAGVLLGGIGLYVVAGSGAWDEGPAQRGWHDKAAGTMVLRARAQGRAGERSASASAAPGAEAVGSPPSPASPPAVAGAPSSVAPAASAPVAPAAAAAPAPTAAAAPTPATPLPGSLPPASPTPGAAFPSEPPSVTPRAVPDIPPAGGLAPADPLVPAAFPSEPPSVTRRAVPDVPPADLLAPADPLASAAFPSEPPGETPAAPPGPRSQPPSPGSAGPARSGPGAEVPASPGPLEQLPDAAPGDGVPEATIPTVPELGDLEHTRLVRRGGEDAGPAPEAFALVLGPAERVVVSRRAVVGRRPVAPDATWERVTVADPGQSVSQTHLEVHPVEDGLEVLDRGSTNGTVLVDPDGGRWSLPPARPALVGAGWTLVLGNLRVAVEAA
ncbi:MAG: RDD family protein [Micrococcales bacterium]|nr:RDD family protein [Micrococcales bacterium]